MFTCIGEILKMYKQIQLATHSEINQALSFNTYIFLLLASSVVMAYQAMENNFEAVAFFVFCALIRSLYWLQSDFRLNQLFTYLIYAVSCFLISTKFVSSGILNGLFSLLICLQALTIIKLRHFRELKTLVWVHLFLTAASLLFYLQIQHAVLLLISAILALACLLAHFLAGEDFKQVLNQMLKLVLIALPIGIVLFLVMPKLPPLWKMPKVQSQTRGLQDELSLGDLAALSQSSNLAFRASFKDKAPEINQLYWRSFTLQHFDGTTWRRNRYMESWQAVAEKKRQGLKWNNLQDTDFFEYQIITEASFQHWLFGLDLATSQQIGVLSLPDFGLYAAEPLTKRFQYSAKSYAIKNLPEYDTVNIDKLNLQLPSHKNPKTAEWVLNLKQNSNSDDDFINKVLTHFNQQAFYYSLKPQQLTYPLIDDFMFNTRTGFCEHYASAFTYIMRLAGIPARVVVGYLGGEYNPAGDYYSVYQFDAHAWSEIWQADKGWQRVDPTLYVAPQRIGVNLQHAVGNDEFLAEGDFSLIKYDQFVAVKTARMLLANLDYQWTRWVLNYDTKTQKNFLKQLFGDTNNMWQSIILIALFFILFAMISFFSWWLFRAKNSRSEIIKLQDLALNKLNTHYGLAKETQQTPTQLLAIMSSEDTDLISRWQRISLLIEEIRFSELTEPAIKIKLKQLKVLIKNL